MKDQANAHRVPQRDLLLGLQATRKYLFPGSSGPSERTWAFWKSRGYFSVVKIGRRVFCDPNVVRAELTFRFTVPAVPRKPTKKQHPDPC